MHPPHDDDAVDAHSNHADHIMLLRSLAVSLVILRCAVGNGAVLADLTTSISADVVRYCP